MQKKTFCKWVNSHLSRVGLKIQDLYVDLRDGKMLIKLLEVLSGERLVLFYWKFLFFMSSSYCCKNEELPVVPSLTLTDHQIKIKIIYWADYQNKNCQWQDKQEFKNEVIYPKEPSEARARPKPSMVRLYNLDGWTIIILGWLLMYAIGLILFTLYPCVPHTYMYHPLSIMIWSYSPISLI